MAMNNITRYTLQFIRGAHFEKNSSNLAGWWIFRTTFHEDFKNVNFIKAGHTPSTHNVCPRSPRTGSATGCVGRVGASRGFVWSKIKKRTFLRIEKLSYWQSPVKIHDVVGTPNIRNLGALIIIFMKQEIGAILNFILRLQFSAF